MKLIRCAMHFVNIHPFKKETRKKCSIIQQKFAFKHQKFSLKGLWTDKIGNKITGNTQEMSSQCSSKLLGTQSD